MLLSLDLGNTNIELGLFSGSRLCTSWLSRRPWPLARRERIVEHAVPLRELVTLSVSGITK